MHQSPEAWVAGDFFRSKILLATIFGVALGSVATLVDVYGIFYRGIVSDGKITLLQLLAANLFGLAVGVLSYRLISTATLVTRLRVDDDGISMRWTRYFGGLGRPVNVPWTTARLGPLHMPSFGGRFERVLLLSDRSRHFLTGGIDLRQASAILAHPRSREMAKDLPEWLPPSMRVTGPPTSG